MHKTHHGDFLAYSCWPDMKTRDESWPKNNSDSALPKNIIETIKKMKMLAPIPFEEIILDILEDKLFC